MASKQTVILDRYHSDLARGSLARLPRVHLITEDCASHDSEHSSLFLLPSSFFEQEKLFPILSRKE
jgi:hypothetical protein